MAKNLSLNINVKEQFDKVFAQFRHLDSKDPSSWPLLPRFAVFVGLAVACVVALWFLWLSNTDAELTQAQASELKLREEYKIKLAKAVNLESLKKQREQVQQYVTQLEKQLPSKAEMDALLSDINQSGLGRSLQFELFRPGQVVVNDYYAELPIALRVTGRYHDIGAFAADIANLSRIVTLNNMVIGTAKEGVMTMDATAKTFRYLDGNEINAQRKAKPPSKPGKA
ncbi:MAG: type 4a pilus biogenesis protein PilO [Rhodoferax sp.]|uniref:type 4a pilus biogenesis protein PilO n=1 Tax=Rhodoferax sp. TaxID=50421 RepID=UPI0008BE67B6|nr:type 4a pilus biogenesis protein PilO [Rhodoferax sp.]MDO8457858.1 type 4a pilus biogenesis protein PilO [Burkholderiaceae bacterium]OGB53276.1 MAG: pilus assembly protein PilO [Burkholderiales bacterium RIFOXYD12_FULL_59_19]OGB82765.1 MAG: pilus assembly protein PilO [Burkholderiales bacterium RIFOXYC12_FULL_60_6]OGB85800.1 MAG: pilus assembly protein PilO [Burkholderiales bacterium RIFOXYD2_FULL_59_8]MDP2677224.1 type 4a pilus biogenesis protein PilO [Rhodoferax sp.]